MMPWRIEWHECLASTNDLALARAQPGLVIAARQQTAGRGQYGRPWLSRHNSSLLMSATLDVPESRPAALVATAAVAVARAVNDATGLEAKIKWPNDLLIREKKVAGILIERQRVCVVGIGLNLLQTEAEFSAAGLPAASSLLLECGAAISPDEMLQRVLLSLENCLEDQSGVESEWRRRLNLESQIVKMAFANGETANGLLTRCTFDNISWIDAEGRKRTMAAEHLRGIARANGHLVS